MNRWIKFFTERFPLISSIILVTGICLSGIKLSGHPFHFFSFFLSFVGIVFALALTRLMGDVKQRGKENFPASPPSFHKEVIGKKEGFMVIETMQIVLFVYSLIIWVLIGSIAFFGYIGVVVYFWLMYKDFGTKLWLKKHPLIYGILNQLIIFPIAIFSVAIMQPSSIFLMPIWSFALILFGAFSCYEMCSNLDPHIHPAFNTYLHFYGFHFVFNVAVICLAISAMGAINLGLAYLLIPCEFVVLAALSAVFFQHSLFRMPQIMSSISLMLHAWAFVIY